MFHYCNKKQSLKFRVEFWTDLSSDGKLGYGTPGITPSTVEVMRVSLLCCCWTIRASLVQRDTMSPHESVVALFLLPSLRTVSSQLSLTAKPLRLTNWSETALGCKPFLFWQSVPGMTQEKKKYLSEKGDPRWNLAQRLNCCLHLPPPVFMSHQK